MSEPRLDLDALGVVDVAHAMGLAVSAGGGAMAFGPCPACGQETRHRKSNDKRPAVGVRRDDRGWRCHQCDQSGNAVQLAAWVLLGDVPGKGDPRWRQVIEHLSGITPHGTACPEGHGPGTGDPRASDPRYPAPEQARALWAASQPACDSPAFRAWLDHRPGIRGELVTDYDLARVSPSPSPVPWAQWAAGDLVVPIYDAAGERRSFRFRRLGGGDKRDRLPWIKDGEGYHVGGLVYADPLAVGMLCGHPAARQLVAAAGLVIVEGLPAFLAWATRWSDADPEPMAVIGIGSGAWTQAHAARIPDGARVVIDTDHDAAGEAYRQNIKATLQARHHAGRLHVQRAVRQTTGEETQ